MTTRIADDVVSINARMREIAADEKRAADQVCFLCVGIRFVPAGDAQNGMTPIKGCPDCNPEGTFLPVLEI